jgi:RNA polymerase sigma factor (TIGR02999 family)
MPEDHTDTVSALMLKMSSGDPNAVGHLVERLYPELRKLAAARMRRERTDHTWQPSALVNELYLELVKIRQLNVAGDGARAEKAAFFGLASHIMGRLLVDHARRLYRRVTKSTLDEIGNTIPAREALPDALSQVDDLLDRLEAINPRMRSVVELRVFEGLSGDEIAARLGCTRRTVVRDWNIARELISSEVRDQSIK